MLNSPSGLAVGPDGAVYVSDTGNNRVVKFSGGTMTVIAGGATASGGQPYGNLLVNPSAEAPVATPGRIVAWNVVLPLPGGWEELQTVPDRPEPLDGDHFFSATVSASAELSQEVSVFNYQTAILAGNQIFVFTAFVHSIISDGSLGDAAQIVVEFLDPNGTILSGAGGGTYDSGQQVASTEWKRLTFAQVAPPQTRNIRVRLISTRHSGTGNDAYYDGLSLRAFPGANVSNVGDGGQAINGILSAPHGLTLDQMARSILRTPIITVFGKWLHSVTEQSAQRP